MSRLNVCVWFVALMCISPWCKADNIDFLEIDAYSEAFSIGQERENIDVIFPVTEDTTWVVNYFYSVRRDTFDISLTIPKENPNKDYKYMRVHWGEDVDNLPIYSDVINLDMLNKDSILVHDYPKGRHFLTVEYHEGKPSKGSEAKGNINIVYCIFNQFLEGNIEKRDGEEGCIEWGLDTFHFKMIDHKDNPPGTKYTLSVTSDAPGGEFWEENPDIESKEALTEVVFNEASGSFGVDVFFKITYQEENSLKIKMAQTDKKIINVYEKPDLRRIFNFVDTLDDSYEPGSPLDIELCTNAKLETPDYDSTVNEKYKYHNSPSYGSRYDFGVDYFRKDSLTDPKWRDVTETDMVDTNKMIFNYPGYYKINMVASNECGADTLNTDSIRGVGNEEIKRHIIVHQSSVGMIRCASSVICGEIPEEGQEITFVDAGKRFKWDATPEYQFYIIRRTEAGIDTVPNYSISKILHYYKGNQLSSTNESGFDCDSTLLKIKLTEAGVYNIWLTRSGLCSSDSVYEHTIVLGDKPEIPSDSLWKYLGGEGEDLSQIIAYCGARELTLPDLKIDSNYLSFDSILWTFEKGSEKDTLLQPYPYVEPKLTYDLDALDENSYIILKAKNDCGWSEDVKINFNTYTQPDVSLLRDSTVCAGLSYAYHWEGKMPKKYQIEGTWSESIQLNNSIIAAGIEWLAANSGDNLVPETGTVVFFDDYEYIQESFEIINAGNSVCKQVIEPQRVHVLKSELNIRGGIDTIKIWPLDFYQFTSDHIDIDTSNLKEGMIWENINGKGVFTDPSSFKAKYTLDSEDKNLDTLFFKLSAYSKCDQLLEDTLTVIIPHPEFGAGVDTICAGVKYKLWGEEDDKTNGKFVQTDKLEWRILNDLAGSLSDSGIGVNVEYTPSTDASIIDTVKIEVQAWHTYNKSGEADMIDTVFLKVNTSPQHIFPDTLYLKAGEEGGAREIIFSEIKGYKDGLDVTDANCTSISWSFIGGDGIGAVEKDGKVKIGSPPSTGNYGTELQVSYTAYKGCSDLIKDVDFIGVVPPVVVLEDIMVCAKNGDCIELKDSITGRDKFTVCEWSVEGGDGDLTVNQYCFGATDPATFNLVVRKDFVLYTNMPSCYTSLQEASLKRAKEPKFSLKKDVNFLEDYEKDTLCAVEHSFLYKKEWIKGNFDEANYTKDHFVTSNIGLVGVFPNFTLKDGVEEAKLIVSVDLGYCPTWKNIEDTLHIVRNKKMTGEFSVHEICEGEILTIEGIKIDKENQGYSWEATNGAMGGTNQDPIFTPNSIEITSIATITLKIKPPYKGCVADSIERSFFVKKKPTFSLQKKEAVMCEDGTLVIETGQISSGTEIDSIIWEANGKKINTTKLETSIEYQYNATHVNDANKIEIIAYVRPKGSCSDVIKDTITVTVNSKITINTQKVSVCQGSSLQLNDSIIFKNATATTWSKGVAAMGELNGTIYTPGEISGVYGLSVKVEGLPECESKTYKVVVDVNASILPIFTAPNAGCENKELEYSTEISSQSPNSLEWYVDDISTGITGNVFKHTFKEEGSPVVGLETKLNGRCRRFGERKITILDAPDVDIVMTPDSIIGRMKEVKFEGTENVDITRYEWDFDSRGEFVSSDNKDRIQIYKFDLQDNNDPFRSTRLTVTGKNGCSTSKTQGMKIVEKPVIELDGNFDFDKCTGKIVFQKSVIGEGITYSWDFGDGSKSDSPTPTHQYDPTYQNIERVIVLTALNVAGEDSDTLYVTVISKLDPDFIDVSSSEHCESRKGFRNATEGVVDSYEYSWGDEKDTTFTSYVGPIYHQYNNSGIEEKEFKVFLVAINQCHTDTIEKYIGVQPNNFEALLEKNSSPICFGDTVIFENVSRGFGENAQAYWYFEGGNEPINDNSKTVSYQFNTPGRHQVVLVMIGDCGSDSDTGFVEVKGDLSLDFEIEEKPYCSEQGIKFNLLESSVDQFTNFKWTFGNKDVVEGSVLFSKEFSEGTHEVSLTATSIAIGACPTTTPFKSFTVKKTPIAKINLADLADTSGCLPHKVSQFYCDNTQNANIKWVLGDGTEDRIDEETVRNIVYETAGEYMVVLTAIKDGCEDLDTIEINAKSTPDADFELPDSLLCNPSNMAVFINNTSYSTPLDYEWFYTYNGTRTKFDSDKNPEGLPLIDMLGRVEFKLKVTDGSSGCSDSLDHTIISGEPIELILWGDTVFCGVDSVVSLGYKTFFSDFADMYCLWDKDGDVEKKPLHQTEGNISHIYSKESAHNVQVVVENRYKCLDTAYHKVNLYKLPISLDFEISKGPYCTGQDVSMHIDPDIKNDYTDFKWDFGNGEKSDKDSIKIHYLDDREYPIVLTANSTSPGNCLTEKEKSVLVNEMPDVYIKSQGIANLSGCTPFVVEKFSRGGNINEGITWDFKNGHILHDTVVRGMKFEEAGEYNVQLSIKSSAGCVGKDSILVVAKETPEADFTFPNTAIFSCFGGLVDIELENKTPNPKRSAFEWWYTAKSENSIKEERFSTEPVPPHLEIEHLGEIQLKLIAKNKDTYCPDTLVKTIISGDPLKLVVDIDTALCDGEVLKVEYSTSGSDAETIESDMGDGHIDVRDTFNYVYNTPEVYNFKTVAKNKYGCKDSLVKKITVYPVPIADFSFEKDNMAFGELDKFPEGVDLDKLPDVENGLVKFTNYSSVDEYDFSRDTVYSTWNFGDSTLSSLSELTHHFQNNGRYEVELLVKTAHGCVDSAMQYVYIDAVKGLFIPNAFAPSAGVDNPGISLFQPKGIGLLSYKIHVYDKEGGTCVWSSNKLIDGKPAEAWDGTFNGQALPKDHYVWEASAIFIDGTVWERRNGTLILIR